MLVHLRHGVTHDVLACWFQVDRPIITRAVGEIGPCSPTGAAGSRTASTFGPSPKSLPTSASPLGPARMDAAEIRVRRPSLAGRRPPPQLAPASPPSPSSCPENHPKCRQCR
ncbi:transposase family protein [Streptomyces sp. NPDC059491]|uniref:transposase family protein n=1 Tax=Streptomyces sp. NPDC059491 TaxID=3346850 RepID=UPI003685BDA6